MDHLEVELRAFEGGVVEFADVVEEVAGEGGVGVDCGALEAEVVVVVGDLFVDCLVVDGKGDEWDFGSHGVVSGEEAAVDVFERGGRDDVVVDGDELDADVFEGKRGVAVVGDDDADGDEAVLDVGETEEVAVVRVGAGFGGDGDVLLGVGIEGDVLVSGLGGRGDLFVGGEGRSCEGCEGGCAEERLQEESEGPVGLHGQVDYHLRWRTW